MLTRIDRLQLAVISREEAARGWIDLLGAEHVRDDRVAHLNASRSVYQVGRSLVEFVQPDDAGLVAASLEARGRPHLFAVGVSTPDLNELVSHVEARKVTCVVENDEAFITLEAPDCESVHFVATRDTARKPVGLLDKIYEATLLDPDHASILSAVTDLFGLDASVFCPITSTNFMYTGSLTLFDPDEPDRFEVIQPTSDETTMGRYCSRYGRSFYMAYAETPHMLEIERRAEKSGAGITINRPQGRANTQMADSMWLHPPALGGMMLGLSRPTQVWSWSGRPDRVEPI